MRDRKQEKHDYYLRNKEKHKQQRQKWYAENRDKAIQLSKNWQEANPERAKENRKAWEKANPDRCHNYRLKQKYGITKEDFDNLLASQNCQCAICHTDEEPPRGWHVDHCHTTEKVRGVLCSHCNFMLGYAKDSTSILQSAIQYLKERN